MNTKIVYPLIKYFAFFVLLYILHCAEIQGLHPFAFGMLFALVWCNQKIYILAPIYLLAGFLCYLDITHLIIDAICVAVFLLAYFVHFKFKKPLRPWLLGIYAVFSQGGMLYFAFTSPDTVFGGIVTLILGIVAMYAYLHIMESLVLRGLRRKFLVDEIISAGVMIFAIGAGLYSVPFGEYIYFGVLAFSVLFIGFTYNISANLVFALALGLGASFAAEQFLLLSQALMLAATASATKSTKRVLSCIAVVLIDIIVGLYFMPAYSLYNLLATMIGVVLFLLLPSRFIDDFISHTIADREDVAVRAIVNRSRKALYNRLFDLSEVFFDMKRIFNGMVGKGQNFEETLPYLVTQVKQDMCLNCPNRNECLRIQSAETDRAITEMLRYSYERGKVSLLDVPANLCAHCQKLNALISSVNGIVSEYKNSQQSRHNLDSGRMLLAEQMYGVSRIMKSLAAEVDLNITFDTSLENKIIDDLLYAGIVCSEAVVYRKQGKLYMITLVVKKQHADKEKLARVISKTLNTPMIVTAISNGEKSGFNLITVENANKFDVVFGSAGAVKADSNKSGDTHTAMKVSGNKVLLALSDGMGSGDRAERTSSMALGLIEDFYRAGFDNSLVLSGVNKLLSLSGEESFSALDAGVLDLNDGTCDLIKLGSPVSYIKGQDELKRLDSGSMPLGILEELKPNIRSLTLRDGDMIILLTDGISDAFQNLDELDAVINDINTMNPQILANKILDAALEKSKNFPADDMTVLVARVFSKY